MAGSNAGTGWPLHFFCVKCRRTGRHQRPIRRYPSAPAARNYTGSNRGVRGLATLREYQCPICRHVGWSRHVDIVRFSIQEPV